MSKLSAENVNELVEIYQIYLNKGLQWMYFQLNPSRDHNRDVHFVRTQQEALNASVQQSNVHGAQYCYTPVESAIHTMKQQLQPQEYTAIDIKRIEDQLEIFTGTKQAYPDIIADALHRGYYHPVMLRDFLTGDTVNPLAKINPATGEITLFNNRLKPITREQAAAHDWTRFNATAHLPFLQQNQLDMKQTNLEFLANQLKYTGFPDGVMGQVKAKMETGEDKFTVAHQQSYGDDKTTATLHFKKSDTSDAYFFNRYDMQLKTPKMTDPIQHTFHINAKQQNITHKEAYNLLSGRAVYKEITPKDGEKYNAWLQLELKSPDENGHFKPRQFHPNYGYDLQTVVGNRPIKELDDPTAKKELLRSLERGNRAPVTFKQGDREVKAYIEAAPQYKSLNYYGENHKRIDYQQIKSTLDAPVEKAVSKENKMIKEIDGGESDEAPTGKRKRTRQSM